MKRVTYLLLYCFYLNCLSLNAQIDSSELMTIERNDSINYLIIQELEENLEKFEIIDTVMNSGVYLFNKLSKSLTNSNNLKYEERIITLNDSCLMDYECIKDDFGYHLSYFQFIRIFNKNNLSVFLMEEALKKYKTDVNKACTPQNKPVLPRNIKYRKLCFNKYIRAKISGEFYNKLKNSSNNKTKKLNNNIFYDVVIPFEL